MSLPSLPGTTTDLLPNGLTMKTLVMTRPPTLLHEQACIVLARWTFAASERGHRVPRPDCLTLYLQRLDFDLAKLHEPLVALDAFVVLEPQAVLQRDPSRGKFGILRTVDGLLTVERHGECRALCGDL